MVYSECRIFVPFSDSKIQVIARLIPDHTTRPESRKNMIRQNFKCSLSTAVFTTRSVINLGKPITIVLHENDDGNWKFLNKEDAETSKDLLKMVSLQEILMIDPTISEIAFLKEGNIAIRNDIGDEWKIAPISYQMPIPSK